MIDKVCLALLLSYLPYGSSWARGGETTTQSRSIFEIDRIEGEWGTESFSATSAHPELYDPELEAEFAPTSTWDEIAEIGNSLLRGPDRVLDWVVMGVSLLPLDGMVGKLIDSLACARGDGQTFARFVIELQNRERDYWMSKGETEIEAREVWKDQQGMVWEALCDALLSRFLTALEKEGMDSYGPEAWQGSDFVVVPALAAGLLYFEGIRGSWNMGPAYGQFELASIQEIRSQWGKEDLSAALAIGAGLKPAPLLLVVIVGIDEGSPEVDFIGFGTSIDTVRDLLRDRK